MTEPWYYTKYDLQTIIPAAGWQAIYAYRESGVYAHAVPLVCFAVVKVSEHRDRKGVPTEVLDEWNEVMGVCPGELGTIEVIGGDDNLIGYLAPGEDVREFEADAKRFCEEEEARARIDQSSPRT